jgi:thymidylate kinase
MDMEGAAVTVATGALGPVLVKLSALLGNHRMEGRREASDIKSIKSELEAMAPLLTRRPEAEDWMGEARELFYDIDDTVEHLMRYFYLASARKATNPFRDLRAKLREVTKRCRARLETTPEAVFPNRKPAVDPRARFLHKDASELVGMDKQRAKVMKLLQGDEGAADLQPLKMVCIVGFAGTGKTTLADLVYQAIGERFQFRAFASLCASSTTSTTDLLKAILRQVAADNIQSAGTEAADTEHYLVNYISNFLADKRYADFLTLPYPHFEMVTSNIVGYASNINRFRVFIFCK